MAGAWESQWICLLSISRHDPSAVAGPTSSPIFPLCFCSWVCQPRAHPSTSIGCTFFDVSRRRPQQLPGSAFLSRRELSSALLVRLSLLCKIVWYIWMKSLRAWSPAKGKLNLLCTQILTTSNYLEWIYLITHFKSIFYASNATSLFLFSTPYRIHGRFCFVWKIFSLRHALFGEM